MHVLPHIQIPIQYLITTSLTVIFRGVLFGLTTGQAKETVFGSCLTAIKQGGKTEAMRLLRLCLVLTRFSAREIDVRRRNNYSALQVAEKNA